MNIHSPLQKARYVFVCGVILVQLSCSGGKPKHTKDSGKDSTLQTYFSVDSSFSTPFGVRKTFTLPDTSEAILNALSHLTYAKGFTTGNRQMALDGDAFFAARKGTGPFRIHTGMLILTGQGASFRVYAHRESAGQSVEVLSGSVTAIKAYPSDYPDTEQLRSGDMVMINRDIDLMEKETFDTAALKEWLSGKLIFDKASFPQIIHKLEDWYDVDITVTGNGTDQAGDQQTLTLEFLHQPLSTVLDTISRHTGFTYQINGHQVTLTQER